MKVPLQPQLDLYQIIGLAVTYLGVPYMYEYVWVLPVPSFVMLAMKVWLCFCQATMKRTMPKAYSLYNFSN